MVLQVLTTASPIRANTAVSALTMVMPTPVRALRDTRAKTAKQVHAMYITLRIILFWAGRPGSNPLCCRFRSLGIFDLYTIPQFTQLHT